MLQSEKLNQQAYDHSKAREKVCAQWLKQLSTGVRKSVIYSAFFGIVHGIAVIIQAALIARILQALIIEQQEIHDLTAVFAGLLLVFVVRSLCVFSQQVEGFEAGAAVKKNVRQLLTEKVDVLGPAFIKTRHSGELAAVMVEQVEALENYFARYLPQQIIVGVLPVLMIAVVLPVNWVVALIFLVTGPLIPVFMALIGMGAASANRSQFLVLATMGGYFLDRLQGLTTLKLFGQAENELHHIRNVADSFRKQTMIVLRIAFLSSAVLEFFSAVAIGLVAVYVGLGLLGFIHFGPAVDISLQEASFVLILAPEFFMPLRQLAIHYHDRAAALGAAEAIVQILEQDSCSELIDRKKTVIASDFLLRFVNVYKYYDQRFILQDINFDIRWGEKIALIGESGAGKTTLLNLLLGFEPVSSGEILLSGRAIDREGALRMYAWVGQNAYIFAGTIAENIVLANPEASTKAISGAAKAAGVTDFSDHLVNGLNTVVGERGYGLSGGQVQRIALARAFLKNAPVVVLDEPTAHLDRINKLKLLDVIDELFKSKTVIIATHDPDVITRMNRRIELVQGMIRA